MQGHHAIRVALAEQMTADPSVILLGDSVGRDGGIAGTTQGLLERFGPSRVRDLPVADRAAMGFAVGLALGGQHPVVELTSTGRLPAVVEVLSDAARTATREFPVPLVVRVPYGSEAPGLDRGLGELLGAGVRVLCAADVGQAAGLLKAALAERAPVVLLEPRAMYNAHGQAAGDATTLGARVLRQGHHVTVAAWGTGVAAALEAAERLGDQGLSAEVIDLVSLSPIDTQTLASSVQRTGRLVVGHPGDTFAADLVRRVGLDQAFLYLEAPLTSAEQTPEAITAACQATVTF